ncbi:uncharacterized protein LOC117647894 [Thrips palmi]|uniref:Uncharacterized protein LOC117647894 n=1 Tax=Thrips palmi TaxID=161013 RepID=A0A6P8ZQF4_THRPL|nr:uncharacterized protein LOC117647894 [Thrips palmi]
MVRVCVLLLCAVTLWALCPESSAHPAPTGIEVNSGSRDKRNPDAGTEVNAARRDKRSPPGRRAPPFIRTPTPGPPSAHCVLRVHLGKGPENLAALKNLTQGSPKGKREKTLPPGGR